MKKPTIYKQTYTLPSNPIPTSQRVVFFAGISCCALLLILGFIFGMIAFILAITNYVYIHNHRFYCVSVEPVNTCNISLVRGDNFLGWIELQTSNYFSLSLQYSMNDNSLVELPNLHAISIRGQSSGIQNDLTIIPSIIPHTGDSSSTIPYEWHSSKIYSQLSIETSILQSIREQPMYYIIAFFTSDCPSGAMYGRIDKTC